MYTLVLCDHFLLARRARKIACTKNQAPREKFPNSGKKSNFKQKMSTWAIYSKEYEKFIKRRFQECASRKISANRVFCFQNYREQWPCSTFPRVYSNSKKYLTSLHKISILTENLIAISTLRLFCEINSLWTYFFRDSHVCHYDFKEIL